MTIKALAAKLRRAAEVLEDLVSSGVSVSNETADTARKISERIDARAEPRKKRKYVVQWTPAMRKAASLRMKKLVAVSSSAEVQDPSSSTTHRRR